MCLVRKRMNVLLMLIAWCKQNLSFK
jgi:hypothetical protein